MGNHRMFSKRIINSAKFLRMPPSSRLLYYDLGMEADDDGVVEAFSVMRKTGACEDDLRVLVSKEFITILNEDLVSYINDWTENNKIRADRKVDSVYKDLVIRLIPDAKLIKSKERADTGKKTGKVMDDQWTSNGQPMDGISKDKLSKDKLSKDKENKTKENPENLNLKFKKLTKNEERKVFVTSLLEKNYVWSEDLEIAISDWLEMRDKIKKPATDRAIELSLADALRLAKQCGCTPDEIFNQSTKNSWQGLFPLKQDGISHAGMSDDELEREWNGDRFKVGVWKADKARG